MASLQNISVNISIDPYLYEYEGLGDSAVFVSEESPYLSQLKTTYDVIEKYYVATMVTFGLLGCILMIITLSGSKRLLKTPDGVYLLFAGCIDFLSMVGLSSFHSHLMALLEKPMSDAGCKVLNYFLHIVFTDSKMCTCAWIMTACMCYVLAKRGRNLKQESVQEDLGTPVSRWFEPRKLLMVKGSVVINIIITIICLVYFAGNFVFFSTNPNHGLCSYAAGYLNQMIRYITSTVFLFHALPCVLSATSLVIIIIVALCMKTTRVTAVPFVTDAIATERDTEHGTVAQPDDEISAIDNTDPSDTPPSRPANVEQPLKLVVAMAVFMLVTCLPITLLQIWQVLDMTGHHRFSHHILNTATMHYVMSLMFVNMYTFHAYKFYMCLAFWPTFRLEMILLVKLTYQKVRQMWSGRVPYGLEMGRI